MTISLLPDDAHDRALLTNVHPQAWTNPTPSGRYNLVVLGAGTAGLVCAAGAAGLGAKVALIERELMGGDCLNAGCVPSKALLRAARAAASIRDAAEFGIRGDPPTIDFAAVMDRLRRTRAGLSPTDSAERFKGLGVDVYFGQGRFTGVDTLEVGGQTLRFSRAVIATGARASTPPIPGLAEAGVLTNENVFTLTSLPRRLAVIGAGPIGCELAQAFARLGSKVTLLELLPRILPREDADAAELVRRSLIHDGVDVVTDCAIASASRQDGVKQLLVRRRDSDVRPLVVDAILAGAGRQPNVENLGLESANVSFDAKKGVTVDDHLRTTNSRIFAAGDICSRYQFTHAADAMARIVLQNALFLGRAKVSALTIPWCTYTDPEVARVGLSEDEAVTAGVAVDVYTQELAHVDRAVLDGEAKGFVRILTHRGSDRIAGATVVAAHAGEMIGEVSLAMTNGLGLRRLASTIHPYPTQAEALRKVGDAYNRTRLTPWVRWLFGKWLAWRR